MWRRAGIRLSALAKRGPALGLAAALAASGAACAGSAAPGEEAVPAWYNPLPLQKAPPAKTSPEAATSKVVRGPALDAALRGNALRRSGPHAVAPQVTEHFATNGTWMLVGTRVPADGSYRFDGDRFCVEFPQNKLTCRQLLLSPKGNYFTRSPNDTRHAESVSIIPSK